MIWLTGVLVFALGVGLAVRGYSMLRTDISAGVASARPWTAEFWLANPDYPAMGLGHNGRWALHMLGGLGALVAGWRLVRIAGRMD
jgi:hypothetical protein